MTSVALAPGRVLAQCGCGNAFAQAVDAPEEKCPRCRRGAPVPAERAVVVPSPRPARRITPPQRITAPEPADETLTLAALGAPAVAFAVYGVPGPQGSKKSVGTTKEGRPLMVESSAKVDPWRKAVRAAAIVATGLDWIALTGPLVMDAVFTLAVPGRIPPAREGLPACYPDVSKLLRSTEDGSVRQRKDKDTWAGVIADDSLVVAYRRLRKFYVGSTDPDALPQPGAVVRVWHYPEGLPR